jgi:glutamine amidotransferase
VRRFADDLVVPQVGWNRIRQLKDHPLFINVPNDSFFYFVHSYYCEPANEKVVAGETDYGLEYASVVTEQNICGVQFHPEKSQAVGLQMLANFAMSDVRYASACRDADIEAPAS